MNVAMMQPTFIPWLGYFALIAKSDVFVFLDDFQLSIQSYHQRNRLFSNADQVDWYITPIQKSKCFLQPLNKTLIQKNNGWRQKLWRRIEANYRKSMYFNEFGGEICSLILSEYESLAMQNIKIIKYLCDILGYNKIFRYSSEFAFGETRSELVLKLLDAVEATRYFSARGSFEYMFEDGVFPINHIEVLFQNFECHPYYQVGSKEQCFYPYLSILDALFNVGPQQTGEIIKMGTTTWDCWNDMIDKNRDRGDQ